MRRPVIMACIAVVLVLVLRAQVVSAQGCQIGLTVDPQIVHLPYNLPSPGDNPTFGEVLDVNYSASESGQEVTLQYQNGTDWLSLQSFTANSVGFTETTAGLNSGWARAGLNSVRVAVGSCYSSSVNFTVVADQSAVPNDILVYVVLVSIGVVFFLIGRWLKFGLFVVVAATLYLAIAPYTGQRYDVYFLASSGIRILQHVNPFDPGQPQVYPGALKWAYPPLYAVYSAFSYLVYQFFTGSALPSVSSLTWPGFLTSTFNVWEALVPRSFPVLVFLLKLPMVGSAVGTAILLRRMTGRQSAAVFWLANPLVILVAAIWGQLDPIATLLAVASVYYHGKNKPYHAYLLASLGAAVKLWPILLVPLFLASSLRRDGHRAFKPVASVLPALLATLGMYAVYGSLVQTLFVFLYARGSPTFAGQFSVNGLTWQVVLFKLGSPPVPLFLVLGVPLYIVLLARVYQRGDRDVTKWLIVSILIFYLTYNYVNPQYFYWILPFLILQGRRAFMWVFTALPMVYVALSYNVFYFVSPAVLFSEFSTGPSIVEQLKVEYFYRIPILSILVSAYIPTLAYFLLLRHELRRTLSPELRRDLGETPDELSAKRM